MNFKLNEKNILIYLIKNSSFCEIQDLYDDLIRVKYIKRLLIRFKRTGDLKERLLLNHIIMLKSFLVYLDYISIITPEEDISKIQTDHRIDKILRDLHE